MRITTFLAILGCLLALAGAADEHRPKKKEKRNLEHSLSQYHAGGPHSYRLERRISTGPQQLSIQPPPQYFLGPSRPYRKDNGQSLVTENGFASDRGGHGDTIYIPHKPFIKVVEKPVYIKEPEPIIEIIIKESNVTLPAPPTEAPPPPPKKKKEEVQVFYVKYRKNPNGYGKDAVIYDKPVPAISPVIPDEPEPQEEWKDPGYNSYGNDVTEAPRKTTTLRTIIKPDSEVYHSPGNNVKVTFGKEGFDYSKRASKPEDYPGPSVAPEGRQLSSFSNVYFKRPGSSFHASASEYRPEFRAPQPYRPFNSFPHPPSQHSNRPPSREFNNRPPPSFFPSSKPHSSSSSSFPSFSHSISHPPPSQFQSQHRPSPTSQPAPPQFHSHASFGEVPSPGQRKPVPYTPFENIRPSPPAFSQPLPSTEPKHQSFNAPAPTHHSLPQVKPHVQFRPETHITTQQLPASRPAPSFAEVNNQFKVVDSPKTLQLSHSFNQFNSQQPNFQSAGSNQYQPINNARTPEKIIPPGGELVAALPRFEQHLIVDPTTGQLTPADQAQQHQQPQQHRQPQSQQQLHQQSQQQFQQQSQQSFTSNTQFAKQAKSPSFQQIPQQYFQQGNSQNSFINQHPNVVSQRSYSTTPAPTTTTPVSTTAEPENHSTTTKDPKVLEAQLPDEVPDDLREQLLSSGILNNADISILDYDKVGDIPLSALPPDQLANFYGAGGAQQLAAAGSEPVPQVAALTAPKSLAPSDDQEMEAEESEISEVLAKPDQGAEVKVVKYDPETEKGRQVQEAYISDDAQQVDPVVLNDNSYNRYLPLKVNGTQFPIPDAPELKGKRITSVVVLAPITYDFASTRKTRSTDSSSDIDLIQSEPLKKLLNEPTAENYKQFLDSENKTAAAKQSIILLVTGPSSPSTEKEIFMYDIATKTVSKLSGELSSAFVEAAEANSDDETTSSDKVETKITPDSTAK
ncbi:hypothetical protein GWI33_001482 [Rhynchophorus ferrugineus]|uniref:Uncharacterized protein n=1 Tax=Rhynchophorus ferrugineus TaxID=354439 RepID=A0A834MGE9_RHYFE|nr:hypothetical protein GWI33_001482 [Rhynchophorus ferrugineus]